MSTALPTASPSTTQPAAPAHAWLAAPRGLGWFLTHPRLWWRPLVAYLLGATVLVVAAGGTMALLWPTDIAWYHWLWRVPLIIGAGAAVGIIAWSVVMPLVLALAFDAIARTALQEHGVATQEESTAAALGSTLQVVIGTLLLRLRWLVIALLSGFTGPLGIPLAAFALTRVAAVDAYDTVLAQRGLTGEARLARIRAHASDLRRAAAVGAALQMALAFTFIGWLLWMPAMVAGLARWSAERNREEATRP